MSLSKYSQKHISKAERFVKAAEHDYFDTFFDTAISHAYYAMHHAARALLLLVNESPKTHSGVINVLWKKLENFKGLEQEDVKNLSRAFNRRVESDYGVEFEIPDKETAREIIDSAKIFVAKARAVVENWK